MKNLISKISMIFLTLVLGAFALTAQAHEFRDLGNGYIIGIGGDTEPPTTGLNQADFFAFYGTFSDPTTWVALDKNAGDKVEVGGFAAKFASEDYNAPITQVLFPILYQFIQTNIEGNIGYLSNNFNVPSIGAYGYIIGGELKKVGHPKKTFAQKFVCGAGSKDTVLATSFECIQ
ncbi:MAG: hypothetical protein HOP23_18095 [Methylococcaceae bacterium]|nr:hypothetical protein [Methylococcaceae bacterium]